ncbi:MAG: (Fe-S)-binding protein, partial [Eubacteriales bacterium]
KRSFASAFGVGWANTGGEAEALGIERFLAVDGIHNVIKVLEEIENDKMPDLEYLEALSCVGGCVGGPLTFENCYVAKNNIQRIYKKMNADQEKDVIYEFNDAEFEAMLFDAPIMPVTVSRLNDDMETAMAMMKEMEAIEERLPGLDCGACGSPTCKTMAEDIVRGFARETDCIYVLRDRLKALTGVETSLLDKEKKE